MHYQGLQRSGAPTGLSRAYFAYLRHPWNDESSIDVAKRLARENGVLTLPGGFFGPGQEQYLRVAFANVDSTFIASLPERLSI